MSLSSFTNWIISFLIKSQNTLKKKIGKLSGPRALSAPRFQIAVLISSSMKSIFRRTTSALIGQGRSINLNLFLLQHPKTFLKCNTTCSFSSTLSKMVLSFAFNEKILLVPLLILAILWKKAVFASSYFSHLTLNHCCHFISSCMYSS